MADQDLPPGWTAIADEEGDYYYWNEETDEVLFCVNIWIQLSITSFCFNVYI